MRAWTGPGGELMGSDVDGRVVTTRVDPDGATHPTQDRRPWPRLAAVMPGADQACAVSSVGRYGREDRYTIHEPGTGLPASRVEPGREVPPLLWWRLASPRDPAGSAALRSISDKQAHRLVAGAGGTTAAERTARADELVRSVLPQITDDRLVAAVRRDVILAWDAAARLAEWAAHADAADAAGDAGAVSVASAPVVQYTLRQAIDGFHQITMAGGYWSGGHVDIGGEIDTVGRILTGAEMPFRPSTPAQPPEQDAPLGERDQVLWASVLGAEAALALRMMGPGLTADHRTSLRVLLDAFARSPLVSTGGRVRVLNLTTSIVPAPPRGTVLRLGGRPAVVVARGGIAGGKGSTVQVVTLGPVKASELGDGTAIDEEHRPTGWADGGRLRDLLRRFDSAGPPPWRPEAVTRLVELTGLSRGSAALLLAGAPGLRGYEVNFLSKQARQTMGLSVAEARTGRDALAAVPATTLVALLEAAMPADPADLWRTGPDVDALAAAWIHHCGRAVTIDPELVAEATRVLTAAGARNVRPILDAIITPTERDLLAGEALTGQLFGPFAMALAWLAYRLPIDDPIRSALPQTVQRLRARLREPKRRVPLGYYQGEPYESPALIATATSWGTNFWTYELIPARLSGPDDPVLRLFPGVDAVRAIAWLLTDGCTRLVDARPPAGAPPGSFAHDPRVAAPSTVESAAAALGVETDAAAYYLQLLALPDPSDKSVARWTGWSTKRIRELGQALVERGRLVAAKRERAGRSVFLPGAWLPLKSPNPPIEAWKTGLYGMSRTGSPVLSAVVPLVPVPSLFAEAWRRVDEGDEPKFEQLGDRISSPAEQ
jgi:hypothetical protein